MDNIRRRDDSSGESRAYQPVFKTTLPGIATFLQHQSPTRSTQEDGGYHPTSTPSSTDSDASNNSSDLRTFKSIMMPQVSASRHVGETRNVLHAYPVSSSSGSSGGARTHVNYKLHADTSNRIGFSVHHRPAVRTSRYLREVDRRNILRRIEQGEKQANLAKEYQVSRAAISNLKQRRIRTLKDQQPMELLTQKRASFGLDEPHPVAAQHLSYPCRTSSSQFPHVTARSETYYRSESESPVSPTSSRSSSSELTLSPMQLGRDEREMTKEYLDRVIQVNTTTVEILFARILDQRTDPRIFEMSKTRIARLLLEHAVSIFQTREIEILVPSAGSESKSRVAPSPPSYLGIEFLKPTCAVSVSSRRGGSGSAATAGGALLQGFRAIEPLSETGSVSFKATSSAGDGCHIQLPQTVHESNILLLVDTLSSSSAQGVAMAIQAILQAGGQPKDICIVAICSHARALAQVLEVFPHVRVITAKTFTGGSAAEVTPPSTAPPVAQTQRGARS